jgi:hypothetical protein
MFFFVTSKKVDESGKHLVNWFSPIPLIAVLIFLSRDLGTKTFVPVVDLKN